MNTYIVTLPIAGHLSIEVKAENKKDAITKALESEDLTLDKIEAWDALREFNSGNVCHCPLPWEAEAELAFGEDAEAEDAA